MHILLVIHLVHEWNWNIVMMHSPEVELTEIFVSNIFNGNGLAPSDKPPDTKNTTRGSIISEF